MATSPSRRPQQAPEAAAAAATAAGKGDPRQAGSERTLLSNPGSSSPAGRGASPLRGLAGRLPGAGRPGSPSRASAPERNGGGRSEEPRARAPEVSVARRGARRHVTALPAADWRRGERAVPGGPWSQDPRREQDGGQGEEEEGEHLGPFQVHRQDHPREVPGRPGSQRRPERLRPAAQPGAGRHHRVHERSG